MANTLFIKLSCSILLLLAARSLSGQCSGCTTTYASSTGANVTVSSGQTICINSGVTLSGQVFLNGGQICNNGTINNLRLTGGLGRINNYGIIRDSESSIGFSGSVFVYCFSASQFSFASVSLNMTATDSLYFNLSSGANVYFANNLGASAKKLSIVNAGTFRVGNNLSVNNCRLQVINSGMLNIGSSVNLTNTGKKVISNTGTVTIDGNMDTGGNGSSTATVSIENGNKFFIAGGSACTMIAGKFRIKNSGTATFTVGTNLTISETTDSLMNDGNLEAEQNMSTGSGIMINSSTLTCGGSFTVGGGRLFNYNQALVANTILINAASEVKNYGLLSANRFDNSGKFRFGEQGLLQTVDYYHAAGDTIFGADPSVTDTMKFARIWISGYSLNTGHVTNNLLVFDESLVHSASNIDYGFDSVTTTGNISASVLFVRETGPPGNVGVILAPVRRNFFYATATASTYTIACGTPVTLNGGLFVPYSVYTPVGALYNSGTPIAVDAAYAVFTWSPGGATGQNTIVTPTGTTTYTVSVAYMGLTYTAPVTIHVIPITLSISGAPDIGFAIPDNVTLGATPSGGSPAYTYNWSPNAFFVNGTNNTLPNPQVSPNISVTYTVNVTDANGCPATGTVNLVAQPYAHLLNIPDGGHYLLFNNKLLFKYDGQYAATALVCNIYNKANTLITTGSFSSLVVNSGDNRYAYNASSLAAGYYTMEVINEKNEKLFLRFIR